MKKLIALVLAVARLRSRWPSRARPRTRPSGSAPSPSSNQILGGVGDFHRGPVVGPAPVVDAPPAPVYVSAPVVLAPRVIARPYPVYVPAPRHVVVHRAGGVLPARPRPQGLVLSRAGAPGLALLIASDRSRPVR